MPATFGAATIANNKFSIYCTYIPGSAITTLTIIPTSIALDYGSGSSGTFNITSNTSWSITDDASWLDLSPVIGSINGTVTVTANSPNTGTSPRTAIVTISGAGVSNVTLTVIQANGSPTATQGNTEVYSSSNAVVNRRAMPVTFSESGSIQSISIYHNGGTGNVLLGVYSDASGLPSTQLGVSAATVVNSTAGWQTVSLTSPVTVTAGQKVWLSWVFQNSVSVRYTAGTPGRAQSNETWLAGMPATFGAATIANNKFSIYCTYLIQGSPIIGTLGNTEVYSSSNAVVNRRAMPVIFPEAGSIQSISIYHNGGTGNVLLGVYSDASGLPSSQLGVTPATVVNSTAGWQTVSLTSPVTVTTGQKVWLSWVFQNSVSVRYTAGTPGRAQSNETWSAGMPATFGAASIVNNKFSIYCTYIDGLTKSAEIVADVTTDIQTVETPTLKAYPNPFTEKLNIEFSAVKDTKATLEIYNMAGSRLEVLFDGPVNGGELYTFKYLPRLVSSQIVLYKLTMDGKSQVGKVMYNERR
jgi:hypothetical protein